MTGIGPTKPSWIKIKFQQTESTENILRQSDYLHTVCQSAHCPNRSECWAQGTATFMVMGEHCTRACRFCAVKTSPKPPPLDPKEPVRLANSIHNLNLKYAVVTSVDRDDLTDGGSNHFADCIRAIRIRCPQTILEVLVPDFLADEQLIQTIIDAKPHVVSHNIETVERLTPKVRDRRANYAQSLKALQLYRQLSNELIITKSGIMVGFGEQEAEMKKAMEDLRSVGVDVLTIGQYLQPTKTPRHIPVDSYVVPDTFRHYEDLAYDCGFKYVASGPLVRSSYHAAEPFISGILKNLWNTS